LPRDYNKTYKAITPTLHLIRKKNDTYERVMHAEQSVPEQDEIIQVKRLQNSYPSCRRYVRMNISGVARRQVMHV